MKRIYSILILAVFAAVLTGCGDESSITKEQNDLIAEYAASKVLQQNPDYEDRLSKNTNVSGDASGEATTEAATTEAAQTSEALTDASADAAAQQNPDLSSLYSKHNLQVLYMGYELKKSYSDSSDVSASVEPEDGGQLLVIKLDIKNTSKKAVELDMIDESYSYSLDTPEGVLSPMLTMLNTDFSVYQNKLKAGASKKVVVLFEVPKGAEAPLNYTFSVNNGNASGSVIIP